MKIYSMQMFRQILFPQISKFSKVFEGNNAESRQFFFKRQCSTAIVSVSDVIQKRNYIFSHEQKRQLEEVGRVEQIAIEVSGPPEDLVLMMNQNISTPYDCCKHISLPLCKRSPLALINENILWDMHRPLPGNCKLKFLSFKDKDPYSLNETFWRTGSFILGAVISKAFKDGAGAVLHRFPECRETESNSGFYNNAPIGLICQSVLCYQVAVDSFLLTVLNTGSFFYDFKMNSKHWKATIDELKVLSAEFLTFVFQNHKIERLDVKKSVALKIFEDNPYKMPEISINAAESKDNTVTLYRVGDHIDLCNGPMIGDTSFFGRATVAAVHNVSGDNMDHGLFRIQGVALPKGIMLNAYAYNVLVGRGAILNEFPVPDIPDIDQFYSEFDIKNSKTPIHPEIDRINF